MRLLYIEDERDIAIPLINALQKRRYAVDYAEDGESGLQFATINEYDCIILDLNLPKIDGLEVAKRLRKDGNDVPILMLTARTTNKNILEGFSAGTDDYLTKPFYFKELLARIEALIRRSSFNTAEKLSAYDIEIDTETKTVLKSGKEVNLNIKEYGILEYLLRNRAKPITQEELLEHVWDESIDLFSQTVRTNIKTLRKKIDPNKEIIETVIGRGYVIK